MEPPVVLIFLIVRPSAASQATTQIASLSPPRASCSHLNPGPGSHLEMNMKQIKKAATTCGELFSHS